MSAKIFYFPKFQNGWDAARMDGMPLANTIAWREPFPSSWKLTTIPMLTRAWTASRPT
jgi:hypothetical protein